MMEYFICKPLFKKIKYKLQNCIYELLIYGLSMNMNKIELECNLYYHSLKKTRKFIYLIIYLFVIYSFLLHSLNVSKTYMLNT